MGKKQKYSSLSGYESHITHDNKKRCEAYKEHEENKVREVVSRLKRC